MATVTITRHFSGFTNLADKFSVGNFEADGGAEISEYELPDGYSFDGGIIYDPDNIACIITKIGRAVTLVSRFGSQPKKKLVEAQ